MSDRRNGTVKWFDPAKGYGFIVGDDGSDVFVHFREIQSDGFRTLKFGQNVDFQLVQGDKGYSAKDVVVTEAVEPESANSLE